MNLLETKEKAFLKSAQEQLETQTRVDVEMGRIKLVDICQVLRTKVTGGASLVFLLESSTIFKKGISDWDGNKLPSKENIILSTLRLGYGAHATEVNPAKVKYERTLANVPASLQNASVIIKQNDKVLVKLPVSALMHEEKSREVVGETGFDLKSLQLIKEQSPIEINLEFPEGVGLTETGEHFLEVSLVGQKTAIK